MNLKTTYILFGVLAILVGVVAFALWYDPTARNDTSKYVLPVLQDKSRPVKVEDIDRVEIDRGDKGKIVLARDADDRWSIVEPKERRADKVAVSHLLSQIFEATREEKISAPPSLGTWGLEPPEETITFHKGSELTFKLLVGKVSPGESDAVIYVMDPARPKEPMAVKKARLDAVLTPFGGFRDTELLASAPSDVQAVSLARGKESVAWKKEEKDRWVYTDPKNYGDAESGAEAAPAGQTKAPGSIATVLSDVAGLKVEKADGTPEFIEDVTDLSKYDLEPGKALKIGVTRREPAGKDADGKAKTRTVEATLYVGKKADDKGEKYYARMETGGDKSDQKTVVKVTGKYVEPLLELLAHPDALRDRTLVRLDGPPSAVRIKNGYGEFELFRTAGLKPPPRGFPGAPELDQWTLWRGDTSRSVDAGVMRAPTALVNLLRQKGQPPVVEDFIDTRDKDEQAKKEKELGLDRPRAVVSLWSDEDGVKEEEKKDADKKDDKKDAKKDDKKKPTLKSDEPTYRLSFGDPISEGTKKLVAVKREVRRKDGWDVTLVKVPETALDEARKGPLAYQDKSLERFTDSGLPPWKGVTKVVIQRGKETVEAAREKDDAPWKIVKPTEQAGRDAEAGKIDDVLGAMNRLTAQRLEAEKATDEDLEKKYGLKPPQARVEITVKKDDKPVTYAYDFGKDTNDGGVYAKQSQRDTIFTVDKTVVNGLPAEVINPVLFTLDTDKVRKVKLTGWQKLVGSPVTLEFERKDKSSPWEVKKGPDKFKLDGGKVDTLLNDLHTCRAERFVEFKSGPKPKYKLDLADDALVVEITVEGKDKPITLTVGAPSDDDKGFYATTSETDGDVVVLFKGTFTRPKKEGSGYFSQ
jgi:hypothetical protein